MQKKTIQRAHIGALTYTKYIIKKRGTQFPLVSLFFIGNRRKSCSCQSISLSVSLSRSTTPPCNHARFLHRTQDKPLYRRILPPAPQTFYRRRCIYIVKKASIISPFLPNLLWSTTLDRSGRLDQHHRENRHQQHGNRQYNPELPRAAIC